MFTFFLLTVRKKRAKSVLYFISCDFMANVVKLLEKRDDIGTKKYYDYLMNYVIKFIINIHLSRKFLTLHNYFIKLFIKLALTKYKNTNSHQVAGK